MRILVLSYFFEPDLSAGSFRNTALVNKLRENPDCKEIHIITTSPNRYASYSKTTESVDEGKVKIDRIKVPIHDGGFLSQIKAFGKYFFGVVKIVNSNKEDYDFVYASSSKLFTAFLGVLVARRKGVKVYLDIRDIFVDSINDLFAGKFYRIFLKVGLKWIERFTFKNATHINLVSEGFSGYFKEYDKPTYTYYTNGIDDEFLNIRETETQSRPASRKKVITYAGNIGEGQGLHIVIPHIAKQFENEFEFRIIGDGGAKQKLLSKLEELSVENVFMIPPRSRKEIIQYYNETDFLFVHLNDFPAFKKVLPSKLFECAAFDKPIIAGVGGYAAEFIRKYIENTILVEPGDVQTLVESLNQFEYKRVHRSAFIEKFNRNSIMEEMTRSIVSVYQRGK